MATGDLCTLDDVRRYSASVAGSQLDGLINTLITTQSAFVKAYLERELTLATYTESYGGERGKLLPLLNWPIVSVSSVVVDGNAWSYAANISDIGYRFNDRFLIAMNQLFTEGFENIQVTYQGGYAPGAYPNDIVQACAELVSLRLEERKHQGQRSKTLAGEQVVYLDTAMPKSIAALLDNHRSYIRANVF